MKRDTKKPMKRKNISPKITAIALAGLIIIPAVFSGCGKNNTAGNHAAGGGNNVEAVLQSGIEEEETDT